MRRLNLPFKISITRPKTRRVRALDVVEEA